MRLPASPAHWLFAAKWQDWELCQVMNYSNRLSQWHNLCLSHRISCIPSYWQLVSAGGIRLPFHLSSLETSSAVSGRTGVRKPAADPRPQKPEPDPWAQGWRKWRSGGTLSFSRRRSFGSKLFLKAAFSPVGLFLHTTACLRGSGTCCVTGRSRAAEKGDSRSIYEERTAHDLSCTVSPP